MILQSLNGLAVNSDPVTLLNTIDTQLTQLLQDLSYQYLLSAM